MSNGKRAARHCALRLKSEFGTDTGMVVYGMNRFFTLLAAALVLLSGCAPASLALGTGENAPEPEAAIARSAIAKLESKQQASQLPASIAAVPQASAQESVDPAHKSVGAVNEPVDKAPLAQQSSDGGTPDATLATPEPTEAVPDLWIDMSMGVDLVEWFNDTAYSVDVARVDHVSMIDLLENIEVGRRLVIFKNVADAEQLLPRLADKMDIIGYNLEHGPANRPDERRDPVGSVQRMRALADEYDKQLALGPDRAFALSDGVAMAPYVDMFVLQVQRAQTEPDVVLDFVLPLVAQLRAVNPDIEISVQVRTEGDPVEIADLIRMMEESLDGVSILTNGESTDIARALVAELRVPPSETPGPVVSQPLLPTPSPQPSPTRSAVHAAALPTASAAQRRAVNATPSPVTTVVPASVAAQAPAEGGWLFVGTVAAFGILVAGLLTTAALYAVQRMRR